VHWQNQPSCGENLKDGDKGGLVVLHSTGATEKSPKAAANATDVGQITNSMKDEVWRTSPGVADVKAMSLDVGDDEYAGEVKIHYRVLDASAERRRG
jgi:hypothetical protein